MKMLIASVLLVVVSGCMSFTDRPFRPLRDSLAAQMPEITLEKEMGVVMRSGIFDFLDVVTLNEADLSEIEHLQVAVYTIHPRGGYLDFSDVTFEESLMAKDASLTWERIVKVRDDGEQVWVYAGMNLEENLLQALSVFVLEQDELVLINMEGDLNEMLEYAMQPARGHRGIYTGV